MTSAGMSSRVTRSATPDPSEYSSLPMEDPDEGDSIPCDRGVERKVSKLEG